MKEATISKLQQQMTAGELSARDLVSYYLERIERLNGRVNAVLECNPDALELAGVLDAERYQQGPRGPLHGIPILLKDNIDTADRMTTTAGSLALEGSIAPTDAFITWQLREAGAVILGKTNLSEWANFRSTRSSSGWSSRGGQTRNPYALDRTPGGSSSGSGVAVAADLCTVAIGTETDGSISGPAAMNSLVGIKPTLGLVSRAGIIPISHNQDTAGPMARSVRDAVLVLNALTGIDARDGATRASAGRAQPDYSLFLQAQGLQGARIGVARDYWPWNQKINAVLDNAISVMQAQGAEIFDPVTLADHDELGDAETLVLSYDFKADLNAYLATTTKRTESGDVLTMQDIIDFNEHHRAKVMPYFEQENFYTSQARGALNEQEYLDALAVCRRLSREQGIDAALHEHRLDAIIAPTTGTPWLIDLVNRDNRSGGCARPPAVAGYPHITVPAGYVFGLPVGLSFIGGAFQEPVLIKLAYAFEQATKIRQPPQFSETASLS